MRRMQYAVLFVPLLALTSGCAAQQASAEDVGETSEALSEGFSHAQMAVLKTLGPVPDELPIDTTNKYADSPGAAKLGQMIFFEKRLSGPIMVPSSLGNAGEENKISCADCHQPPTTWLYDVRSDNGGPIPNATALGAGWFFRNVSTLVNTVFYVNGHGRNAKHWRANEGFSDSEWFDAQAEPETNVIFNGSRLRLAHVIFDHYKKEYNKVFPEWPLNPALSNLSRFPANGSPFADVDNWNSMTAGDQDIINRIFVNYGKAIEAYLRTLISRNAPFDRFVEGCDDAISNSAKRGAKVFIGKGECVHCHNTPHFSDTDFHTIGMKVDLELSPFSLPEDSGQDFSQFRICVDPPEAIFNVNGVYSDDRTTHRLDGFCESTIAPGRWRTRSLRHVAETGPYMRNGQMKTLDDVINFYDRGGDPDGTFIGGAKDIHPLHLTNNEKKDLKAFLKTLTGEPPPAERLVDIHKRD